jgi:hypothetical protein
MTSIPLLKQVKAAETRMRKAQHSVFDYVQGLESSGLDPKKYHRLNEVARKAANHYARLVYDANSQSKG